MQLRPESVAFTACLALSVALALGAAGFCVALLAVPGLQERLIALPRNTWWFSYAEPGPAALPLPVFRAAAAALGACAACVAALHGRRLYRKSPTPLLPFIMVFLFSLSLECLRAATGLLYAADASIPASVVITRVIYWGRFVGLLGLLVAALYCVELKYRRLTVLAGVVFLVSFSMAAYIPIDRTVFLAQLTWRLGDEQSVWFVNLVIGSLVVVTAAIAAYTRRDRRFLCLAGGFLLFLASREILFFATHPLWLAGGLAFLAGGASLCLRTLSVIHRQVGERTGM
jgi:hypothetical protein